MPESLFIVIFFIIILLAITLIGHGIWSFFAFIFGARKKTSKRRACVFCGNLLPESETFCYQCVRDLNSPMAEEIADLNVVLRQLKRFHRNGTIKPETIERITKWITNYREQLLRPSKAGAAFAAKKQEKPIVAELAPSHQPSTPTAKPQPPVSVPAEKKPTPAIIPQLATPRSIPQTKPLPTTHSIEPQVAAKSITPPLPPKPPAPPRKPWTEILGGFLAERNIRLTELIGVLMGGLLMVGCSILLIIAFWAELNSIPTLKFAIFVGYSSTVFAAGLFVFHRWKLESTGRGLMTIATLLVPLNFVAMASFYKEQWAIQSIATEIISLVIFTWLVTLAAKTLTPDGRWCTALSVIGNSVIVLLASRFLTEQSSPILFIAAECLSSVLLIASVASYNIFKPNGNKFDLSIANSQFMLLGIAVFCTAVSLGLITAQATKSCGLPIALYCLAIPVSLIVISILSATMQILLGIVDTPKSESYRLAATSVAIVGVVLQIASIILAWPQPILIVVVGIIGAACMAYVALRYDFPAAHSGVMICLTIAYLAGFYTVLDEALRSLQSLAWQSHSLLIESATLSKLLLNATISAKSGTALGVLFLVFAAISELFAIKGKKQHGRMYVFGAGIVAVVGLILVTMHGWKGTFADAVQATILYAAYGIVSIALSIRWRHMVAMSYAGWNLLAFAPMWLVRSPSLDVWQSTAEMSGCLFWLAVVWLLLAWIHRKEVLFNIGQVVLMAASLMASMSFLEWKSMIVDLHTDWYKPQCLQVFGIGLGLLSLVWMLLRIVSRKATDNQDIQKTEKNTVRRWYDFIAPESNWRHLIQSKPQIDIYTTYVVTVAQFLLAAVLLVQGCGYEFLTAAPGLKQIPLAYVGTAAWLLLSVLALTTIFSLWEKWGRAEMETSLILAISAAILIANRFANDIAAASAARWSLAICFVLCSVAVWCRSYLKSFGKKIHVKFDMHDKSSLIAQGILIILTALPVLLLTLIAALVRLSGQTMVGPIANSFFHDIGPSFSYIIPLALVIIGLVGHALRESSAEYAFGAGLVAELTTILGYTLYVTLAIPVRSFRTAEYVTTLQLASITAAVWAIIWIAARRWVNVWREDNNKNGVILMNTQLGMALLGNAILISIAVLEIFIDFSSLSWAMHAGMPLGWAALLLTAGAGIARRLQSKRHWEPHFVGMMGMAVLALFACTIPNIKLPDGSTLDTNWTYRVLMLGWAIYALLVSLACWWITNLRAKPDAKGPPQALISLASVWVRMAGIAAVILGLKAAFFYHYMSSEDRLWAAAAIAIASTACATMAVWRRREGWAFTAALGVNLAASIVVWHYEDVAHLSFDQWWIRLVQANVIASSVVALLWLAAHKRLYAFNHWAIADSPLLTIQTTLPVIGNIAVLLLPVYNLVIHPKGLPYWLNDLSAPPGWIALLLCASAAAWYLYQTRAGSLIHVLGGTAIGVSLLFTCTTAGANWSHSSDWFEYHMLFTTLSASALVVLACSFLGRNLYLPESDNSKHTHTFANRISFFPIDATKTWTTAIIVLATFFAVLYCNIDTAGEWWRLRTLVCMSIASGIIALWLQSSEHVFLSGIILNLAGTVAFANWHPASISTYEYTYMLTYINILCLAVNSMIWATLAIAYPKGVNTIKITNGVSLPFSHLALGLALMALGILAGNNTAADLLYSTRSAIEPIIWSLGWYALAATVAAVVLNLWDRSARLPLFALYVLSLIAICMSWHYRQELPRMLCWRMGSDLAGFILVMSIIGWILPKLRQVCRLVLIPDQPDRWLVKWFTVLQAVIACIAIAFDLWIALDFRFDGLGKGIALFGLDGRLAAVTGSLMILGASILMAWQSESAWRTRWQYMAFIVGLLFMSCLRWAKIDSELVGPWLHRSVVLLVSSTMMTVLTSFGLRKVISKTSDWVVIGKRMSPMFGSLAIFMLGAVLIQEWRFYQPMIGTPLVNAQIVAVGVIIAAMLATCITFAIRSDLDPLKLSENGRQAYVYIAELLLVLFCIHLRLTKPEWFTLGLFERYWMLIVMAIAFVGTGLSVFFHRLKLPVLAIPLQRTALLLPLLPAIGFWFQKDPETLFGLVGRTPDVWFLIGIFYGLLSYMRRSPACGMLAILTANIGLWVALNRYDNLGFLQHPQLWLIPIALAILIAEFIHHDRLTEMQSTLFRYLSLSVIYISSTADMFIAGIGKDWRLPIVLMALSVIGFMAGVLLKIRSFMLLGLSFLAIDILAMIWYAAVDLDQTWIWYASGIIMGVAIITFFVVLEKRRQDILSAVQKIKEWDQ